MLIVTAFCHRDYAQTKDLYRWIAELNPRMQQHQALIVASSLVPLADAKEVLGIAQSVFGTVMGVRQQEDDTGNRWPQSCNRMFTLGVRHADRHFGKAFFWLEPDCIPLAPEWADALDREYKQGGKPFAGVVYPWVSATHQLPHLTGCAIYPTNLSQYNRHITQATDTPWDITKPEITLKHTHSMGLLHHEWGDRDTNTARTFPDLKSLSRLRPGAVLFHRSKDGTLIKQLREKRGSQVEIATLPENIKCSGWAKLGSVKNREPVSVTHVYTHYTPKDEATQKRMAVAKLTWDKQPWKECPVTDASLPRLFSDRGGKAPFIKDIFKAGLRGLRSKDILVYTNADICVRSDCVTQLLKVMENTDCCYSHRRDFYKDFDAPLTDSQILEGNYYVGCDLYAFRERWWARVSEIMPDMLLGRASWDYILRMMMDAYSPRAKMDYMIYHRKHDSTWENPANRLTLPSQLHCMQLCVEWCRKHGLDATEAGWI